MSKVTRRQFLRYAAVSGAAAFLAACAPQAQPAPSGDQEGAPAAQGGDTAAEPEPAAQGKVSLVYWAWATNRARWVQAQADKYTKEHPEVTITVEQPENIMDKMQATFVAGSGAPDIAGVGHNISKWIKGDRIPFFDLTDKFNKDDVFASGIDPWTWKDKIYGIGNELNACLTFYRWDLLEQYGIKTPIETWEDFLEQGIEFCKASGKKFTNVVTNGYDLWYILIQGGSGLFDKDGNIIFDNDFGRRIMKMMQDWYRESQIAAEWPGWEPQYGAMDSDAWAVVFGAPWFQGFMKDNMSKTKGKWDFMMIPTFKDGTGSQSALWGGTAMSITEQSKNPDIAWDFIRFCNLTVDGALDGFKMENLFPTYKPAWEKKDVLYFEDEFFNNKKPGEWIEKAAPLIPTSYLSPNWFEALDALTREAIVPIMQEGADVDQALANARKAVEALE